jgi:hypothetical protein
MAAPTRSIFARVEPGAPVPPPPVEVVQWANNSLLATLAGTVYGGVRAHVSREPPSLDVHPQARTPLLLLDATLTWRRD